MFVLDRVNQGPAPDGLTIETRRVAQTAIVAVTGELDILTAPTADARDSARIPKDVVGLLVIDRTGL